jgi:CxxC motif-containing protein (DUF1111 family)
MMNLARALLSAVTFSIALAPQVGAEDNKDSSRLSAGGFTVPRVDQKAYSEPAPALLYPQFQKFLLGRGHFNRRWVTINSLEGDWGLGPTFVSDRCSACHVGGGRGRPPSSGDEQLMSLLVRLSVPGQNEHGGPKPHPSYGDQFQNRALQGKSVDESYSGQPVPTEADLYVDWEVHSVTLADGETVQLRKPRLRIENLNFGPLGPEVMTSMRLAQPIFGLGLLSAVPEETLLAIAQQQQAQGLNGRPNYVRDDIEKKTALGRFGWKANQPSVKQQIAAAAIGDIGANSHLYYAQNCPPAQTVCAAQLPANDPELINQDWIELEFWTLALGVPARRGVEDPAFGRGEKLFEQAKCAACHVPTLNTATSFPALPQLANQTFHAYTDLLLHDMGAELADGRPDFKAGPRDWRTAPLWGLGLSETVSGSGALLHDGRARNPMEAILWHGGEAAAAREAFAKMSRDDREALLKFLTSI